MLATLRALHPDVAPPGAPATRGPSLREVELENEVEVLRASLAERAAGRARGRRGGGARRVRARARRGPRGSRADIDALLADPALRRPCHGGRACADGVRRAAGTGVPRGHRRRRPHDGGTRARARRRRRPRPRRSRAARGRLERISQQIGAQLLAFREASEAGRARPAEARSLRPRSRPRPAAAPRGWDVASSSTRSAGTCSCNGTRRCARATSSSRSTSTAPTAERSCATPTRDKAGREREEAMIRGRRSLARRPRGTCVAASGCGLFGEQAPEPPKPLIYSLCLDAGARSSTGTTTRPTRSTSAPTSSPRPTRSCRPIPRAWSSRVSRWRAPRGADREDGLSRNQDHGRHPPAARGDRARDRRLLLRRHRTGEGAPSAAAAR